MHRFVTRSGAFVAALGIMAFAGCSDSSSDDLGVDPTGDGGASDTGIATDGNPPSDANSADTGATPDAGAVDPCGGALFCETFDGYGGVTSITDKQTFGPWTASLKTGAVMSLDGTHTTSGSSALHVHIDDAATAGGRLYAYAKNKQPIFAGSPTHVYGRMRMYIDPNGTSIHWTFFGVDGPAATTVDGGAGRNASYIMSSLPKSGVNTYSFVYGLSGTPTNDYHDCSSQSATSMPSAWACVSFEMDSSARKLRMYKDGASTPILSVDDHGNGCVAPTPVTSPWYGPEVADLFVGAYSFHAMDAPLDVWIDDLVVDTKPVACP